MTYTKQTRQQAMRRYKADPKRIKMDSIIKLIQKGNPGDIRRIRKMEKIKREYVTKEYPEIFEGIKW